jgi:hypothetical protein
MITQCIKFYNLGLYTGVSLSKVLLPNTARHIPTVSPTVTRGCVDTHVLGTLHSTPHSPLGVFLCYLRRKSQVRFLGLHKNPRSSLYCKMSSWAVIQPVVFPSLGTLSTQRWFLFNLAVIHSTYVYTPAPQADCWLFKQSFDVQMILMDSVLKINNPLSPGILGLIV